MREPRHVQGSGSFFNAWTAEEDAKLRELAALGYFSHQVAEIMGTRTQAAVVSRARLLGCNLPRYRKDWTPERTEELRRLIEVERLATKEICKRMGLTRNAVIGRAHRMGLELTGLRAGNAVRRGAYKGRAAFEAAQEKQGPRPGLAPEKPKNDEPDRPFIKNEPVLHPPSVVQVPPKKEPDKRALPDAVEVDGIRMPPLAASLMSLKPSQCRFPCGDKFCGEPRVSFSSYCAEHFAVSRVGIRPRSQPSSFMRLQPMNRWR